MARFAFSPVPEIAPMGAPGNDYERIETSPAMFGGLTAQSRGLVAGAEEKLGSGIESTANAGLDYLKAKQSLTNEISASETNTWLAKGLTDKFNDFGRLQGKAAQDALPQFKNDVEELYKKSVDNAGDNLQMKSMLAKSGRYLTDRYYQLGTTHADSQWKTWQAKTFDDRATEFGNQAAVMAQHGTWNDVDLALNTSDDEVRKKLEAQSYDSDSIAAEVRKRRGANVKNIVDTLSATDPRTAQAVFDKYKGGMDAGSVNAVTSHLKSLNAQLEGRSIADEETGRAPRGGTEVANAIGAAAKATGVDPALLQRFQRIESGGNPQAQAGSHKGLFQLSDDTFAKYGGGDIFNPRDNAMAAARKIAAESHDFEAQYGRQPTAGELYLMHQQGAGGFAAHLANPDRPAWQNMLGTAEGRAKGEAWAKAAIWGNVPDRDKSAFGSVDAVTSRQFVNLWENKIGQPHGALPDKADVYDRIVARTDSNPLTQNAAIARMNQIYSVERTQSTQDKVLFDQRVKDTTAEAYNSGAVAHPLTEYDFVQRRGAQQGRADYADYQKDLALGADVAAAATMSPQDRAALVARYEPQPGPGYAEQEKRQEAVQQSLARLDKQRKDDPGNYAITRMPDAKAAYQGMQKVESDPQSSDFLRQAARRNFAAVMHDEQSRVGIDPMNQRLLPNDAAEKLNSVFASVADNPDPQARVGLIARVQHEASMWGENWPSVMRQLAPQTQPIVRAIAAGADPVAMTRLLSLGKDEKPNALLKEQDETKAGALKTSLNQAMAPYLATLVGNQRDRDYTPFYGLAEQLGSLYVRDGMSAGDAAGKAFNDLIGNRYDFRDTWRVPKSTGVPADDIQAGTVAARAAIASGAIAVKPAVDDLALGDANRTDSLTRFSRDGRFVTAPDSEGLNLAYDNKFVRTEDGSPLKLSWQQLAALGVRPAGFRLPTTVPNPDAYHGGAVAAPTEREIAAGNAEIEQRRADVESGRRADAAALGRGGAAMASLGTQEGRQQIEHNTLARDREQRLRSLNDYEANLRGSAGGRRKEFVERELARIASEREQLGDR